MAVKPPKNTLWSTVSLSRKRIQITCSFLTECFVYEMNFSQFMLSGNIYTISLPWYIVIMNWDVAFQKFLNIYNKAWAVFRSVILKISVELRQKTTCLFSNNTNKQNLGRCLQTTIAPLKPQSYIFWNYMYMYVLQKIAMTIIHPRWYRCSKNQGLAHEL
jgi:hypothetical protein